MAFDIILLVGVFLFFMGSIIGWCIEVLFRRFFTAKKWINPGFLTGPYLPLYGFGTVGLFSISLIPINTGYAALDAVIIIAIMGVAMTLIEYIAGLIFIKGMKLRLWDYSMRWGNIQGIICPLFSFFWLLVSAFFYFVIDEPVIEAIGWFVNHISFAFVVGVITGVFIIDLCHSFNLSAKVRKFAAERKTVVNFEKLKETVYDKFTELKEKHPGFFFPLRHFESLKESLCELTGRFCKNESAKKSKDDSEKDSQTKD